eukprot:TRINITY_DN59641_c0_g1_i1.p1 TRINITY_DN59641_c0_g1~~TRINITY_DN59641_c0_g1_i1.p1  ORF type:complete len:481 (-),score=121.66 TRINITY_DN59641_c0_g1_i1:104-1546(-)
MAALWWKFAIPGQGTHHVRAKILGDGTVGEVLIDGAPVDAPAGTTAFTGPVGVLLELQPIDGSWHLMVDGQAAEPHSPDAPSLPPLWWRFVIAGGGTHQIRVRNIGTATQDVLVDGAPLEAPPGTMAFTGPGGALIEIRQEEADWALYHDGVPAERFDPAPQAPGAQAVAWWRFSMPGSSGVHQVRVKNLGAAGQEVVIDGAPVLAPDGTTTFTGPAGSFLQLEYREGDWVLLVDGRVAERYFPDANENDEVFLWNFTIAGSQGSHEVRLEHGGKPGQSVYIDGNHVPGPQGQMTFTGPGGCLLDLRQLPSSEWQLCVDGTPVAGCVLAACGGRTMAAGDSIFSFQAATGSQHQVRVQLDDAGQECVSIDGVRVDAPPGTVCFTGPGGCLLELRKQAGGALALFVDGVCAAAPTSTGATMPVGHSPVAPEGGLPPGVSLCRETGRYEANIRIGGRFMKLGDFSTIEEAAAKYNEAKAAHR